ncbi:hypothetical protein [Mycolicibacterium diernhoferi]|nr:hypothetical protein [Mycolicibacterium diernhoferi]QYL23707.1 hypothetical protein K0O62_05180 [Mycolicibacterium diernhoferi]
MTTHITGARVIGNHADMGPQKPKIDRVTLLDIVRAGKRRRAAQWDEDCAESRWSSEGGAGLGI